MIQVPRLLLEELYERFDKVKEILVTLEELSNKKGLKRIEKGLQEYKNKECTIVESLNKMKGSLLKD